MELTREVKWAMFYYRWIKPYPKNADVSLENTRYLLARPYLHDPIKKTFRSYWLYFAFIFALSFLAPLGGAFKALQMSFNIIILSSLPFLFYSLYRFRKFTKFHKRFTPIFKNTNIKSPELEQQMFAVWRDFIMNPEKI